MNSTAPALYTQHYHAPTQYVAQADDDAHLVQLWLHGRPERTLREYVADLARFMDHVHGKPLRQVRLADVQGYLDSMAHLAERTRARRLSTVKSLFSFAVRLGYLGFSPAAPVRAPRPKETLSQRILPEADVLAMIRGETNPRNKALLLMLYAGGLRASEAIGLTWGDFAGTERGDVVVTILGKGQKTRHLLLPGHVWDQIRVLRRETETDADPVFKSRQGQNQAISYSAARLIVVNAAKRADIHKRVTCHWLRHAHASHGLQRGANIALVQASLGHSSLATTSIYVHVRPDESVANFLPLQ